MSKTKDTIQEMVTKVTDSFPSVFSKDDVVTLLNELQHKLISQEGKNGDFDLEGFKTDLIEKIENEIELIKEYRASLINECVTGKILLN